MEQQQKSNSRVAHADEHEAIRNAQKGVAAQQQRNNADRTELEAARLSIAYARLAGTHLELAQIAGPGVVRDTHRPLGAGAEREAERLMDVDWGDDAGGDTASSFAPVGSAAAAWWEAICELTIANAARRGWDDYDSDEAPDQQ